MQRDLGGHAARGLDACACAVFYGCWHSV